eukprot:TRINITY_DN1944_c0_g1_i1.p1 TRINITY_DN1944_c0_g1~~TRINITY_DN1944_c0_g1_i1.p1  ORF type:complete len:452 (+),score=187.11 TRINITY_DN1944_c0_g1_i1:249-1604(+)
MSSAQSGCDVDWSVVEMRQTSRKQRKTRKCRDTPLEADDFIGMGALVMNHFTCPQACVESGSDRDRSRKQKKKRGGRSQAVHSPTPPGTPDATDLAAVPSAGDDVAADRAEQPRRRGGKRRKPPRLPSPPPVQSDGEPRDRRRKNRQSRAQCIGDAARARCCFGEELLDIDHAVQLFLLDKAMKAVRLMTADRHERKILQSLARAYKLTLRCPGSGEPRVVELVKTKSSGTAVDAAGLRSYLGVENVLHEPAELTRSPCGPSPLDSPDCGGQLRSPPSIYRAASRMTRVQMLEAAPDPRVLELYYQRYKDGCGGANTLLRVMRYHHEQVMELTGDGRQNATESPVETMYERLQRADEWLSLQRQNKHQIAARRRAVTESVSSASTMGLTSGSTTPTAASAPVTPDTLPTSQDCGPAPAPDGGMPALDLGMSLSMGLTGTLDGLQRRRESCE